MAFNDTYTYLLPLIQLLSQLPLERLMIRRRSAIAGVEKGNPIPTSDLVKSPSPVGDLPPFRPNLPTSEETVEELRRRLGKELYRFELDLVGGCKIAGRACDCCGDKHNFGIEATAEELIPMDRDPTYGEVISWLNANRGKMTVEASASGIYDAEYPEMARQVREFRKRVMGTEGLGDLLTEKDKQVVIEKIEEEHQGGAASTQKELTFEEASVAAEALEQEGEKAGI